MEEIIMSEATLNIKKELPLNLNSVAIQLNKYAVSVVGKINDKYRQPFTVVMGANGSGTATSTMDKSTRRIFVSIPQMFLDLYDPNSINALKILVGHEIAHQVYANMRTPAVIQVAAFVDTFGNNYKKSLQEICIETAADIAGANFYRELCGEITDGVYLKYREILEGGEKENLLEDAGKYVKFGYLPPSFRVDIMRDYIRFDYSDYAILSRITSNLDFICKTYLGKDPGTIRYESELRYNYKKINFPNRINRMKKL